MQIEQMEGQIGLFDQDTWSGKMFQAHSQAESPKVETSKPSSQKSSASSGRKHPMFLYLKTDGPTQALSWESEITDVRFPSLGEYTMPSFGESPKEENASLLSQILEDSPHPKYSLSARACVGILNRAERRGKALPPELKEALERQVRDAEDELHPQD